MRQTISKRAGLVAVGFAVALAGISGSAIAQKKPASKNGNWVKICHKNVPVAKGKKGEICEVMQEKLDALTGLPFVGVLARQVSGDPKSRILVVTVPLNMILIPGVRMTIDKEKKPTKLLYSLCSPNGCLSEVKLTDELLGRLKKGKELTIQSINVVGRVYQQKLPLSGFTNAFNGKPFDKKKFIAGRRKMALQVQANRRKYIEEQRKRAAEAKKNPKKKPKQ